MTAWHELNTQAKSPCHLLRRSIPASPLIEQERSNTGIRVVSTFGTRDRTEVLTGLPLEVADAVVMILAQVDG